MAALMFALHFFPGIFRLYPGCPLRRLTGLYCPGCGGLRALQALARGHLIEALHFNALILFLPLLLMAPSSLWRRINPNVCLWVAILLTLFYGVIRNLPWAPFVLLAPAR